MLTNINPNNDMCHTICKGAQVVIADFYLQKQNYLSIDTHNS